MVKNKSLLAVSIVLIASIIMVGFSSSIQGVEKKYEIRPEITLPQYQTDTARAIDAYERVMDRFINLTERNLIGIDTDVENIANKLILIDYKLTDISARMVRIEKALGIEQPEKLIKKSSDNIDN